MEEKKMNRKFLYKKIGISILFGLIGFWFNFHTVHFIQFENFQVSVLIGLLFPLTITLFWGWRYGLLSALVGGCQSMWWLWYSDGYGFLYAVPIFSLWIVWHGWWSDIRQKKEHRWYYSIYIVEIMFRIISELGFFTIFRWLVSLNPPPWASEITQNQVSVEWVKFVAIKHTITAYILLIIFDVLQNIQPIRSFFLPQEKRIPRNTTWIINTSILVGLFFWIVQTLLDYFFLHPGTDTFLNLLSINIPPSSLITRNIFLFLFLIAGLFLSRMYKLYLKKDEQVRKSEKLFRSAIRTTSEGFILLTPEMIILDVNFALCQLLGYEKEEMIGQKPHQFVCGDEIGLLNSKIAQINEKHLTYELTLLSKETIRIPTIISSTTLYDDESKLIGVCAFIKDIREQKEYELTLKQNSEELQKNLQKSEEQRIANLVVLKDLNTITKKLKEEVQERKRIADLERMAKIFFDTVIENSPFAMWIADKTGLVKRVNRSLCKFLNVGAEQIVDHYNVLEDKNLEQQNLFKEVKSVFQEHKSVRFEMPWKPEEAGEVDFSEGNNLYIFVSMFPIMNADKELTNVVCQWIDITESKKAEQKLMQYRDHLEELVEERTKEIEKKSELLEKSRQELNKTNRRLLISNKELENFAYSVSHDLKAPLRAIIGFSEILMKRHKDILPAEGQKYLSFILEAGNNMSVLITDLLKYARLGHKELRKTNLKKIIQDIIQNVKNDDTIFCLPEKIPVINSNPTLVHQILLNIIQNAIKYRKKEVHSEVTIQIQEKPTSILMSIKDNGIGIEKRFHEKIFSIFQRLHTDSEYKGTGIGLAIVQKAVTSLNGQVWVESELGEGSTFFVEIPNMSSA